MHSAVSAYDLLNFALIRYLPQPIVQSQKHAMYAHAMRYDCFLPRPNFDKGRAVVNTRFKYLKSARLIHIIEGKGHIRAKLPITIGVVDRWPLTF